MTPEQLEVVLEAARKKAQFQAAREARHESNRRQHRMTALAGGGERECARRREQMAKVMR